MFKGEWCATLPAAPAGLREVRYWDRAATVPTSKNPDPDWTAGVKIGRDESGILYILDVVHIRENSGKVERTIKNTASQDGPDVEIGLEQEPGASGKGEVSYLIGQLAGFRVRPYPKRVSKIVSAGPLASQAEAGNVKIIRSDGNDVVLK